MSHYAKTAAAVYKEWVILGPGGYPCGSFDRKEKADWYAQQIEDRRGLECRVVHVSTLINFTELPVGVFYHAGCQSPDTQQRG